MAGYDPDVFGPSPSGGGYDETIFGPKKRKDETPPGQIPGNPNIKAPAAADRRPAPVVNDFSGSLQFATPFGTIDTGVQLPQGVNKRLAQFGSGIDDWIQGAKGIASGDSTASRKAVDEKRKLDAALTDDFTGQALRFGGKVLPALAIPMGGGAVASGAAVGALSGALEPVGTGDSRANSAVLGAGLGAALPGVLSGVKAWAAPRLYQAADLARTAMGKYNIPLGLADITDSRLLKATKSVLNDMPFLGGMGAAQNEAKQRALNNAVNETMGTTGEKVLPPVVQSQRIGAALNNVWDNNTLKLDGQMVRDLSRVENEALAKLNPDQAASVQKQIQNLLAKANNGEIEGAFANNWQSELRLAIDGEKGLAKKVLGDLRSSMLQAFNRGVAPEDAAALNTARKEWGNFRTLEPLIEKAGLGVGGRAPGDIPAGLLPQAVMTGQGGRAIGTDLGELSQIAGRLMTDRVAQTGGSPRALAQNALLSIGGLGGYFGAGGGLGAAAGAAGAAGLGAGVQSLLGSPAIARSVLGISGGAPRGLLDGPTREGMTDAMRELIQQGAMRSPIGLLNAF